MKMLQLPRNNNTFWNALFGLSFRGFFLLVFFLGGTSCENSMEDIKRLESPTEDLSSSSSTDVTIQFSDSAEVKIILKAPTLERFTEEEIPYDLMPDGLRIEFLDSLGNVEAQVICNYAIHYPKSNILELSNDVQVFNKEGDHLNSERLVWNANTQKISSDDFVKITTQDEIIYGDGFVANQDFTDYEISHIKGIISIEDEDI